MANINDLWKELQAAAAPAKGRLKGLSYTQRLETGGGTKKKKGPGFIEQLQPKAGAAPLADSDIMAALQRDINCLSDSDRRLRIKALENISAKLLGAPGAPGASAHALQAALCGPLLVPTVRLLADPAERCRELAATFLGAAASRLEDASGLLPTLLPALEERMGSVPVEEGAEEVRLLLVQLAGGLVQRHAAVLAGSGGGLLGAVVQVLCRGLEDSCPDVKKAACAAVASLADGSCPTQALEPHLDALLSSLLPSLQHQHSRVRLEALGALNSLVLKGLRSQALQEMVAPAVQPLVHDHAPSVRAALFASTAVWMGCRQQAGAPLPSLDSPLAGQFRSSVPIFLPILLLALTEESADIRSSGMQQVEGVSEAYSALQGEAGEVLMEADDEGWGRSERSVSELPGYSHPFQARPSLATSHMVQRQLPHLVELAVKGSKEWTASLRAEAARLLYATLLFAEGAMLKFLPAVLHSLRAGTADEDPAIVSQALAAAGVLSVNVPARHWAAFMVEAVTAEQPSMAQRVADLRLLCALLGAAAAVGQQAQQDTVQLLAAALGHEELVGVDHAPLHAQLLAATSCLVRWAQQQCAGVAPELLRLLLRVAAAERGRPAASEAAGGAARTAAPAVQPTAGGVMSEVAAACGVGSARELCDQMAPRLLPTICQDRPTTWDSLSPGWREFSSLLRCCGSGALETCGSSILGTLQPLCNSHDAGRDPELQLAALALVSEVLQDDSKAAAWRGGLGVALAQQVLLPVLVWRAGKHPAAARHAALTALLAMLGDARLGEGGVLELVDHARLLPLLHQCLDEDYMAETRAAACTAVTLVLQTVGHSLTAEQVQSTRQELLRRLDDSSDPIRIAACQALLVSLSSPVLASALEPSGAEQLASTLLVHMDDANPAVCEAACAAAEGLASHSPDAVRERAAAAVGVHRRREYLDRVLAACGAAMQET